jgi:hypothetical protein
MRIVGPGRPAIRSQAKVASASSDPRSRVLIRALAPSMIQKSSPRRISLSSPPPGTTALSIRTRGIIAPP